MQTKLTYTLLSILLAGTLCVVFRSFGFFSAYNFFSAAMDIAQGHIQLAHTGELPVHYAEREALAKYGFAFQYFDCEVSGDAVTGAPYYNSVMLAHLEDIHGAGWREKLEQQLDSIDRVHDTPPRLTYQHVAEIVADSSYSTWVRLNGDTASLALHFQYKDTLAVSYSPECWLLYPYKLQGNTIVVYWSTNIDTKYNFDIVKAANKINKKYIGQPFMQLQLENDTTLKATYPLKELIDKINRSSKEGRVFFPATYTIAQEGYL